MNAAFRRDLPAALSLLRDCVERESGAGDVTGEECALALTVAWIAALRWRAEQADAVTAQADDEAIFDAQGLD